MTGFENSPVGPEWARRQAYDLSLLTERVRGVEQAQRGRLLPIDAGPGDLVGFDADGLPVLIDAAPGDAYGLVSDAASVGDAKWVAPQFQVISHRAGRQGSGIGTTAFVLGNADAPSYYATAGSVGSLFYLDPADWGSSGVILRLRAWCQTETDPTDSTLNAQVGRSDAAGAGATIGSPVAVTTLADVAMNVTAANTRYMDIGVDTTVTTAGYHFVVFVHSVNPAQAMSYGYTLMGRAA